MQNRRKSNDLNTFRSRNNLVGGSINHLVTDMNQHRKSLPKLVENGAYANNTKFINKKRFMAPGASNGSNSFAANQEEKKKD